MVGDLRVLGEDFRQFRSLIDGVNEHVQRHIFLKLFTEHEVYKFFGEVAVLSVLDAKRANELNLAEAHA